MPCGALPRAGPGPACGGQRGPAGTARRGAGGGGSGPVARGRPCAACPGLPAAPGAGPPLGGGGRAAALPSGRSGRRSVGSKLPRRPGGCARNAECVCVCVPFFFFFPLPVFLLLIRGRSWSWGRCFLSWNTSPESARSGEYPSHLRISLGLKALVCVRTVVLAFSVLELRTESPRKTVLACFYTLLVICCSFLGKPTKICVCVSKHTTGTNFCFSCG